MPVLVAPAARYRDSFLAALREFQAEERLLDRDAARLAAAFGVFVRALLAKVDRATLAPGRVPETVLWLVEGDEFLGRISIRHELTEELRQVGGHIGYEIRPSRRRRSYGRTILALALPRAKALGLQCALVTCDADNIGSKKIIEHNGGKLESTVAIPGERAPKLRYWIDLM